jgi:hypothetical protein
MSATVLTHFGQVDIVSQKASYIVVRGDQGFVYLRLNASVSILQLNGTRRDIRCEP